MDINLLTAIASYYADCVDPDAPQPPIPLSAHMPRAPPSATASLTSNLFFRYCPSWTKAAAQRCTEVAMLGASPSPDPQQQAFTGTSSPSPPPQGPSAASSECSLAHAIPLAFSAAHPLSRLAAERSPSGYRSGGVLVWDRPLSAPSVLPGAYLNRKRGHAGSTKWGWWSTTRQHGGGDVRGESRTSGSSSSGCSSSRSSSVSSSPGTHEAIPPAPLFFSQAMRHRTAAVTAADSSMVPAAPSADGQAGEGVGGSLRHAAQHEAYVLPATTKIVVVLRLYDWEDRSAPPKTLESLSDRRGEVNADGDANTIWRMMGPVMWWLERAVKPADDVGSVFAAAPRADPQRITDYPLDEPSGNQMGNALKERRSLSPAHPSGVETSQHLSDCGSSSSPVAPARAPTLACAIRLFLSPWAMPRRRRHIIIGSNSSSSSTGSQTQPPLSPPVNTSFEVPLRWSPQALVELGVCGPDSDSPVLFSAATFLAALAVNTNGGAEYGGVSEHEHDNETQQRRRLLLRQRRRASSAVMPAFGPFPSPHVPSGPLWPGGGGGRRGVTSWRTPACATMRVKQRKTAAVSDEVTRWMQRPLLELLSLEGVWDSADTVCRSNSGSGASRAGDEGGEGDETIGTLRRAWPSLLAPPSALPVPLLPLHTLDLSFRTDLHGLEGVLSRWASTSHLSRLSRLSVMGCIQLRGLDWLTHMPVDTLEVLNVSGCEELRDLHAVRRLSALRSLKATQLIQLELLGWWWGWEEEDVPGGDWARAPPNADPEGVTSSPCRLRSLAELDLACFRRRTQCLADMEWIGLLPALQKLALSVSEEEDVLRRPVHHTRSREPARHETTSSPHGVTRLAWLAGCGELRELRLAFRDGPHAATAAGSARLARFPPPPPPPPPPSLLAASYADYVSTHANEGSASDLDVLSFFPFPHLRVVELTKAILTEHFTFWLAGGCPQLRNLDLVSCTVHCSAAALRQARAQHSASFRASAPSSTLSVMRHTNEAQSSWLHPTRSQPSRSHRSNQRNDDDDAQQRRKDEQWWWGQLCRLHHLHRLCVYNLEGLASGSSLDWVVGCRALRHLVLRKCRWLLDAYAVHRLPRLRTLNLNATGIDDLTFLRMRDGVMVRDAPLALVGAAARATHDTCRARRGHRGDESGHVRAGQHVSSHSRQQSAPSSPTPFAPQQQVTAPLAFAQSLPPALSHLTELVLVDCPFLSDLSPIAYLTSCRSLFASDHPVTNLDYLSTCISMEKLYLINYVKLTDISALRWLWRLRLVYITHSSLRDVSWMVQPVAPKASSRWSSLMQQPETVSPPLRSRGSSIESSNHGCVEADTVAAHGGDTDAWRSGSRGPQRGQRGSTAGCSDHSTRKHTRMEGECEGEGVLPQLEVLTLAYSRLLTDVSALGALPRLRHLDLRECVSLYQLGSSRRSTGAAAAASPASATRFTATHDAPSPSPSTPLPLTHPQQGSANMQGSSSNRSNWAWSVRLHTTALLLWAGRAAKDLVAHLHRWRSAAVPRWDAYRDSITASTNAKVPALSPTSAAMDIQTQLSQQQPSETPPLVTERKPPASSGVYAYRGRPTRQQQLPTPCSIARLAPTLRYLSLSGCKSLVDATPLGELYHLQYLHASFTGIRDVRWVSGCVSLKVLDLTMSPCCTPSTPSAAAAALLARLPDELKELEVVNSRPVERD
ncbi:hypothetical protein ABL78_8142 [Leptomonas seymouri]|uniref:Leucine-rich repeat protein n=1 Tax=Leptomonas seymouri TaxID=5684 RepID=A0A0N1HZK1_LEPSE|nr:hypothetical protein ABL78_8142 [Leptomonas seymouri]|eukprot:KPI82844.1 hypothetical protein ABL78_8142 [Leptomonas seymouri]